MILTHLRPKPTIQKELKDLKKEYENELLKLKRKVSDFDTSVVMWENRKLREENKKLKEKIEIYEKCISSSHIDGKNPDK